MTKKHFILLADMLRDQDLNEKQFDAIIAFCEKCNPAFNAERWLAYLRGECGPSGGVIKKGRNQ